MSLAGKDADRKKPSHQGAEDFNQLEVMGEKQHIEVYDPQQAQPTTTPRKMERSQQRRMMVLQWNMVLSAS